MAGGSSKTAIPLQILVEEKDLVAKMEKLENILSAPSVATFLGEVIDPYIRKRASDRFKSEGDDVVGKWLPLATTTQDIRAQLGYGPAHPINHRTGQLERFIVDSPERITMHSLGATLVSPGNPPTSKLKSKISTAQAGKGRTPARPVIGINERDLAFTMTALHHFVTKGMQ